jgi:hypothetical protein
MVFGMVAESGQVIEIALIVAMDDVDGERKRNNGVQRGGRHHIAAMDNRFGPESPGIRHRRG